ncbi:tail fiber domain-containing protein [bacterium]|nr:tail fiber domain-containing protein [bacterium]
MQKHHYLLVLVVLSVCSTGFAQKMTVKDSDANILMEVNDEGNTGSISLPSGGAPSSTVGKLYNQGGSLYWNGSAVGTATAGGGWTDDGTVVRLTTGTDKVGIGDNSPTYTLDVAGKIGIEDTQILYLPDQTDFNGTLILGTGGGSLSHTTGDQGRYCTAVGIEALNTITSGHHNTAIGYRALFNSTSGDYNMACGGSTLYNNTVGYHNSAFGIVTLFSNTSGYQNTAVGNFALSANINGNNNMAGGYEADRYNQAGSGNTIIGCQAGRGSSVHSKSGNIFIGFMAGYNESGNNKLYIENSSSDTPLIGGDFSADEIYLNGKVGIGDETPDFPLEVEGIIAVSDSQIIYMPDQSQFQNSLFIGTGGSQLSHSSGAQGQYNTALGMGALSSLETGWNNTACGWKTMGSHVSGYGNTAYGIAALLSNTSGHGNCTIGSSADSNNETGSNNTIIGTQAGQGTSAHSKSGCVLIGYQAGYNETSDNRLYIDNSNTSVPLIWGDFTNNRMVVSGNASHNTSNRTFFVNGSAGGTGDWYNDSDARLKKNVRTIPDALEKVLRLRGVNFEWQDTENREAGMKMGFIAQEAESIIPEVISNNNDCYSMQYASITALLIEAVKEQQNLISELKKENQHKILLLEKRIAKLEKQ